MRACQSLLPSVTDGGDQAFCVGEWSTANRGEAIGRSLHNQMVLTLVERMSIDMFVLTLAQSSVEIRFSSRRDRVSCLYVYPSALCGLNGCGEEIKFYIRFLSFVTSEINTRLYRLVSR